MRALFEDAIDRLLGDLVTPALRQAAEGVAGSPGQFPADLWRALQDGGFTSAAVPEALGGAGAAWADLWPVLRAAGAHAAPVPLAEALLANTLLGRCGLPARAEVLTLAARGTLQRSPGGHIRGTLAEVPFGRQAQAVLALLPAEAVGADDRPGHRPTLLLLPITSARLTPAQNIAGEPRDTLQFDGCTPLAQAPLPDGLDAEVLWLGGALLRCAQTAGALESALALSLRHAGERVQFGQALARFQAIQHQLAQMAEQVGCASVSAETAWVDAALGQVGGGLNAFSIATAQVCSAEAAGLVAALAHGVHGAIGFTQAHALQHLTRRLWSWRSEFGGPSHWQQRLGQAVCAAGAGALWPALTAGQLPLSAPSPLTRPAPTTLPSL